MSTIVVGRASSIPVIVRRQCGISVDAEAYFSNLLIRKPRTGVHRRAALRCRRSRRAALVAIRLVLYRSQLVGNTRLVIRYSETSILAEVAIAPRRQGEVKLWRRSRLALAGKWRGMATIL